jgi:hypothetical protein
VEGLKGPGARARWGAHHHGKVEVQKGRLEEDRVHRHLAEQHSRGRDGHLLDLVEVGHPPQGRRALGEPAEAAGDDGGVRDRHGLARRVQDAVPYTQDRPTDRSAEDSHPQRAVPVVRLLLRGHDVHPPLEELGEHVADRTEESGRHRVRAHRILAQHARVPIPGVKCARSDLLRKLSR